MSWLRAFLESPENRTGLSIWLGTAITALLQCLVLHQSLSAADLLGLVLGLVKIMQPENSVTVGQMQRAIGDVRGALQTGGAAAIANAANDIATIAAGTLQKSGGA
jgi:hypothetical protein